MSEYTFTKNVGPVLTRTTLTGNGSTTAFTVNAVDGNSAEVAIRDSNGALVYGWKITARTATTVTVTFSTAPAAGSYYATAHSGFVVDHAPAVSIAATYAGINTSKSVAFVVTNAENTAVHYDIDWGDGTAHSTGSASPSGGTVTVTKTHTWTTSGAKTVTVVLRDDQAETTTFHTITVDPAPVAVISAPVDNAVVANHASAVSFASTGTTGSSLTYDWDFGDSTTHATTATATHTYANATARTITLTVTDRNSVTATDTAHITFTV